MRLCGFTGYRTTVETRDRDKILTTRVTNCSTRRETPKYHSHTKMIESRLREKGTSYDPHFALGDNRVDGIERHVLYPGRVVLQNETTNHVESKLTCVCPDG